MHYVINILLMSWLREYALPKSIDSGGHSHPNLVRLRG